MSQIRSSARRFSSSTCLRLMVNIDNLSPSWKKETHCFWWYHVASPCVFHAFPCFSMLFQEKKSRFWPSEALRLPTLLRLVDPSLLSCPGGFGDRIDQPGESKRIKTYGNHWTSTTQPGAHSFQIIKMGTVLSILSILSTLWSLHLLWGRIHTEPWFLSTESDGTSTLRSHGSPESAVMEFGVSAVSAVPPTGMAQVATGETGEEIS